MSALDFYDVGRVFERELPIAMLGATGSGKSYALRHMMQLSADKIDMVIAYAGSRGALRAMQDITYPSLIMHPGGWNEEALIKIADLNVKSDVQLNLKLAMDDFSDDKELQASPVLVRLATAGREGKFSLIALIHRLPVLKTLVRDSIRRLFVGEVNGSGTVRELREGFGRGITSKQMSSLINQYTGDHGFLVFDATGKNSRRVRDRVFRYKAPSQLRPGRAGNERVQHIENALAVLRRVFTAVARDKFPDHQEEAQRDD